MASSILAGYRKFHETSDPRTRDWPLCGSAVPIAILTVVYLGMVYFGSKWMKNRPPFSLTKLLIVYNLALTALSGYVFIELLLSSWRAAYSWTCAAYTVKPIEARVVNVQWWYYISKVIELADTLFMVLRKKNRQITFLHVYHHSSMFVNWYFVMKIAPQGEAWFGASINSLVHVLMYSYYGLSLVPSTRKYLWWKEYLTRIQLIQFFIALFKAGVAQYVGCDYPVALFYTLWMYLFTMIVLFANFYIQSYMKKAQLTDGATRQDSNNNTKHIIHQNDTLNNNLPSVKKSD
ncbi:PREDICTED: elongation of very long chain fatty acids protein 2-like [Priapulus caudatus]|uniref:Elongation of very long chain fatty acids protein n=1 Tax=Priapulus caudatus TaxID=37621 RepID=A0ABM1EDA1_PRICU|nr:PREDICTED: elongation of very long chain fatty acids protein 2-like [Priapulus caudatus]